MVEPRVILQQAEDDPEAMVIAFIKNIFGQKQGAKAYGESTVRIEWKNGVAHLIEFDDKNTVKFKAS